MLKKLISATVILLAAAVMLSGCDALTFNSAENLVRPPKLSGDDGDLQSAFEAAMAEKGEYILRYPIAGNHRSAFVRYDCDGDGYDEALVFYSLRAEEMSINMYMFDYSDGAWLPCDSTPGEGNDVYSVEFSDLNNDGISEILVGWSSMDSKTNKKLSVYCSKTDKAEMDYKMLVIESYTSMYTVDLDDDGEKEILLAYINSTSDTYTTEARLLKMSKQENNDFQITAVGQKSLYSEITAVNSICSGRSGGRKYVYIDEAAGNTYLTEILYWNEEKNTIDTVFEVDMLTVASCPTSRSIPLSCEDVDRDGEVEIPVTRLIADSAVVRKNLTDDYVEGSENVYAISWNKYDGGNFTSLYSYISNENDGFRISYDEELMADWCVMFYPEEHISQFFRRAASDAPEGEDEPVLLFTIKAVALDETVSVGTYLTTGKEYKYTCAITKAGAEIGLTRNSIVSDFSVIQ